MRMSIRREILRAQIGVIVHKDERQYLKMLKAVFQTPKVKRSNKNVTMTKRCGAKTDFTNHEAIQDEIE